MTTATGALEAELRRRVQGEVRFDAYSKAMYSTDASIYRMDPVGVVIPRNADDIAAIVEICYRSGTAVLPRGGGTGLAGQTVNHAVVMDFSKYMHGVVEVNAAERWVRAQPGITLDELNHHLRPHRLHFPPDPTTSNRATVGGAIGNNSCGSHSVLYGKTSDHVKEVSVVLSDGTSTILGPVTGKMLEAKLREDSLEGRIYSDTRRIAGEQRDEIERRFPKIMRRVSGYNLDMMLGADDVNMAGMIVGSEGTLATVTEAKLNLEPLPSMKAVAVLHFRSLIEAMEGTLATLEHGPSAVELVDSMLLQRTRESPSFSRRMTFVEGEPEALLLVEFYGESEKELQGKISGLKRHMESSRLGYACVPAMSPEEQANIWEIRRAGLGLLMSVKGDSKPLPFVEDTAVPPEKLPEYVRRFDEMVRDHDTVAGYYGHASVGCLHIRPMVNIKTDEGLEKLVSIATAVSDLVLEYGGSLSGEHGDGIVRGVWTEKMFGSTLYDAFREVKRTFDPKGIMNPGKIVDTPGLTENLRLSPAYKAMEPDTVLDFSADGGFARSVELCNGVGACRKVLGGTMCPSYMVTREEEHSTRGRSNALRSVLSGALDSSEFTSKRLHQVLDLCLECKGCKGECPSNVDMAKLKYEFLNSYYKKHRMPLRARLMAGIAGVNALSAPLAPLANFATRNPLSRRLMHWFLGLHKDRKTPALTRSTFPSRFKKRTANGRNAVRGRIVLFHDTFTDYNEPQVGMATVELLEAAGYEVVLADKVCCGRPMISKGMLERARENARINVERLYSFAREGVPIVGTEPSCLLTLRDEYPDLLRNEESRTVAQNSYLLEELLVKLQRDGELGLEFSSTPQKVLFHGHCHQKAAVGTTASVAALKLVPGLEVEVVDSGCCGMAGSFGYEKEHYEMSMAIGERRLFPAVRSNPEARIAITGFSCRHQVMDGTGREPEHVAEILRSALVG